MALYRLCIIVQNEKIKDLFSQKWRFLGIKNSIVFVIYRPMKTIYVLFKAKRLEFFMFADMIAFQYTYEVRYNEISTFVILFLLLILSFLVVSYRDQQCNKYEIQKL